MILRHLTPVLTKAAGQYPVVSLTGPRQSGKTTLVRESFPKHQYVSLEAPDQREFAREDPRGFLGQFAGKVILDEAQRAPDLFSYIQGIVDERQEAGQFILTGSQNFLLLERISQTLAGRCATLHLLPFSRPELARQPMMDLDQLGKAVPKANGRSPQRGLFETLFAGGYPRIFDKHLDPQSGCGTTTRPTSRRTYATSSTSVTWRSSADSCALRRPMRPTGQLLFAGQRPPASVTPRLGGGCPFWRAAFLSSCSGRTTRTSISGW